MGRARSVDANDSEFPEHFGRYTLLRRVATGGMAEILLAIEDTPHAGKRFVTIKRIREEYAQDPDYNEFFISEGRVSMQCSHPNLTRSFDLNVANGIHYLAMEYIRGHTLLDIIRAAFKHQKIITIPSVLRIAAQVAAGLEHLHSMRGVDGRKLNVVHRDVTPQNIMVDASGSVKLIDLGIARSGMQVHRTQAGTVKGKLSYLAPEQLQGPRILDCRADIFSFGVVLYETLTLRGLFRGKSDRDTVDRVRNLQIPTISSIRDDASPQLDEFVAQALARIPAQRFQSASQILQALDILGATHTTASITQMREEVLGLCGDPPVPTLCGNSFGFLESSMLGDNGEATDANIEYFLGRCGINTEEALSNAADFKAAAIRNQ